MNELVKRWRVVVRVLTEGTDAECTAAVRDWIEEWDRRFWARDFSGFEEIYASRFHGETRMPMVGDHSVDGPDGFRGLREDLADVASRFWFDVREVRRGKDGRFLGLGRMRARGRYSGMLMQTPWAVLWRVEDGRLVEALAYLRPRQATRELDSAGQIQGLSPSSPDREETHHGGPPGGQP